MGDLAETVKNEREREREREKAKLMGGVRIFTDS
jgi:hypothetical protein